MQEEYQDAKGKPEKPIVKADGQMHGESLLYITNNQLNTCWLNVDQYFHVDC